MKIPMVDLKTQYLDIKEEVDAAMAEVMDGTAFILGPAVERFEKAFAHYQGVSHAVGVGNGTDALVLALRAAEIGPGDEVITTPHTFGATVEAICNVGATPVLCDIEPEWMTMDVTKVPGLITRRTRAIIPVHIYGHPVDMDPLMDLAEKHDLVVIEDTAQAHGARYKGRLVGSIGHVGCFSFYPGKNLGAYGDAGGLVTDDDVLAERARMLRNHGTAPNQKFNYYMIGTNSRMDGFQGAVLGVKLPRLDGWNAMRRDRANRYRARLRDVAGLRLPTEAEYALHVYHLFVARTDKRDALSARLADAGIASGVQYPFPLHLTPAYAHLGYRPGDLPVCEQACREIISLPLYPEMTDRQVDAVCDVIKAFFAAERAVVAVSAA